MPKKEDYLLALARISLALIFLWAFFDKLLGLGFATTPEKSWLAGASPTLGFLKMGTAGPFASLFQGIAGNALVDILFMAGLLLIGVALLFGAGLRIAGHGGALLMFLMWLAVLPKENNPLLDEHIVYMFLLLFLAHTKVHALSLREWWLRQDFVKKNAWLE